MPAKKVLLIYNSFSSFVRTDYNLLAEKYTVKKYLYPGKRTLAGQLTQQIKQLFWLLVNLPTARYLLVWFADYHSLLPVLMGRLLGKKVILIEAGYDVTGIKELRYGTLTNPIRAFYAKKSIRFATINLPVSENIRRDALKIVPGAPMRVIPICINPKNFYPSGQEKEKLILTVGPVHSYNRLRIKGIDRFVALAKLFPGYRFLVIGFNEELKKHLEPVPENVAFTPPVQLDELRGYYQKAAVYIQFSMREGLPSAIQEAMLCECVSLGMNSGGIPDVIGDAGYVLPEWDVNKAAELLKKALTDKEMGKRGRQRILDNFDVARRERELGEVFADLE
jgi:glycosyltransferase involved in cell wall biosynthesis